MQLVKRPLSIYLSMVAKVTSSVLPFLSIRLTFNSLCSQCLVEFALPRYLIWEVGTVHRWAPM